MEAWARYRPVQTEIEGQEKKKKAQNLSEIHNKFPEEFINKMMSEIKLK